MRPNQRPLLFALMASVLALAPAHAIMPPPLNEDVAFAIYRHQFANNASGIKRRAAAYCIGYRFGRGAALLDAPPGLVARFRKSVPRVKIASACRFDERRGRVFDRASGRPALTFFIVGMNCGPDACTAEGGYSEGNLSASTGTYQLSRQGNVWRVTDYRLKAIS